MEEGKSRSCEKKKVMLVKATGCGRKKLQETYKCNEVKIEVESANSYAVEVTAATFTRRRMGYVATRVVFVTSIQQDQSHVA